MKSLTVAGVFTAVALSGCGNQQKTDVEPVSAMPPDLPIDISPRQAEDVAALGILNIAEAAIDGTYRFEGMQLKAWINPPGTPATASGPAKDAVISTYNIIGGDVCTISGASKPLCSPGDQMSRDQRDLINKVACLAAQQKGSGKWIDFLCKPMIET